MLTGIENHWQLFTVDDFRGQNMGEGSDREVVAGATWNESYTTSMAEGMDPSLKKHLLSILLDRTWRSSSKMSQAPELAAWNIATPSCSWCGLWEKERFLKVWQLYSSQFGIGTPVFEASSGNTANSLAYMCKLVGVNFTAIVSCLNISSSISDCLMGLLILSGLF